MACVSHDRNLWFPIGCFLRFSNPFQRLGSPVVGPVRCVRSHFISPIPHHRTRHKDLSCDRETHFEANVRSSYPAIWRSCWLDALAVGLHAPPSAPRASDIGSISRIIAGAVITTGRSRVAPAACLMENKRSSRRRPKEYDNALYLVIVRRLKHWRQHCNCHSRSGLRSWVPKTTSALRKTKFPFAIPSEHISEKNSELLTSNW
jgi:hypothetical protein